jgi:hypothetical protein
VEVIQQPNGQTDKSDLADPDYHLSFSLFAAKVLNKGL